MFFEVKNYTTLRGAIDALTSILHAENVSPDSVFDSKLVVSELLGNVLQHSQGEAKLHLEIKDGALEMRIHATDNYVPKCFDCSDVYAEHGRGLFLVKKYCEICTFSETEGIFVKIKLCR